MMFEITLSFLGGLVVGLSIGAFALYKVWKSGMQKIREGARG